VAPPELQQFVRAASVQLIEWGARQRSARQFGGRVVIALCRAGVGVSQRYRHGRQVIIRR
jgi:hypothetical protein